MLDDLSQFGKTLPVLSHAVHAYMAFTRPLPIKASCKGLLSASSCKLSAAPLHLCCTTAHVKQSPSTFGMERHLSRNQSSAKIMPMSAKYASKLAACNKEHLSTR